MNNNNYQKKVYEKWKGYSSDPDIKTIELRYQKIRDYIKEEGSDQKILDLGCADGALIQPFIKDNLIYGVEISKRLCQKARSKGIDVVQSDLEEGIPFKSKTFDIVVAAEIIEHIVNTDFFLAECNRVLKKDGKLVLSVPNINNLFSPIILFLFDYPPPSSSRYRSPHVRDFTFSTLKLALKNNYFTIKKKRGAIMFIPYFSHFLKFRSFLADLFPRCSNEYIIKAKKKKSFNYNEKKIFENQLIIKDIPIFKKFFK